MESLEDKNVSESYNEETGKRERPQLLTIFLILSMINGVMSSFSNFMLFFTSDTIKEMFKDQKEMDFMGMQLDLSLVTGTDKNFFLYQGLLFAVSFTGALLMWNFKKSGFHLYTISQILLLIVATIFLPGMPFPYVDIIFTALFVYVYAKYLPIMD